MRPAGTAGGERALVLEVERRAEVQLDAAGDGDAAEAFLRRVADACGDHRCLRSQDELTQAAAAGEQPPGVTVARPLGEQADAGARRQPRQGGVEHRAPPGLLAAVALQQAPALWLGIDGDRLRLAQQPAHQGEVQVHPVGEEVDGPAAAVPDQRQGDRERLERVAVVQREDGGLGQRRQPLRRVDLHQPPHGQHRRPGQGALPRGQRRQLRGEDRAEPQSGGEGVGGAHGWIPAPAWWQAGLISPWRRGRRGVTVGPGAIPGTGPGSCRCPRCCSPARRGCPGAGPPPAPGRRRSRG